MELEDTLFHSGCQKVSYLNFKPFTHMADYLHSPIIAKSEKKKKIKRLPTLVDDLHLKSKEKFNLYKNDIEFTNLKENLYQKAFLQFKLLCVI